MYLQNRFFTFFLGKREDNLPPFPGPIKYKELECVDRDHTRYRLIKMVSPGGYYCSFHIQMRNLCYNGDKWMFVRSFKDADREYAENCAREVFDYLTKDI